jgi:hypothetical protein
MSICYFTVTPEPAVNPVAYICRVFMDKNDECTLLETKAFPIRNPNNPQITYGEADLYGQLSVSALMAEVQP